VPSMEEFGITAVEAQAAGRPVIAAAAGGALETVLDGTTGLLATLNDVDAFQRAIEAVDDLDFDLPAAVHNAERFSVAAFQERLAEEVTRIRESHSERRQKPPSRPSHPRMDAGAQAR
jgi:glycosyltransferase involved in cell wall biosynthesis